MEVAAKLRAARISAQKARLVADQVRGKPVEEALNLLEFSNKKAAAIVRKVLNSAIANAENNEGADVDELVVIDDQQQQEESAEKENESKKDEKDMKTRESEKKEQ